nr:hypothetical protein [Tanacetum cinerariifolium]
MWGEPQVFILRGLLKITRVRIIDLEFKAEDAKFRLEQSLAVQSLDTIAKAVILEFIIPEATAPVASVRRHRMIEARSWTFDRDGIDTWRRIESDDQQIKTLYTKAMWGEAQVSILQGLLKITGVRIIDLEFQAEDAEFRLERCECGWIHDSVRIR